MTVAIGLQTRYSCLLKVWELLIQLQEMAQLVMRAWTGRPPISRLASPCIDRHVSSTCHLRAPVGVASA